MLHVPKVNSLEIHFYLYFPLFFSFILLGAEAETQKQIPQVLSERDSFVHAHSCNSHARHLFMCEGSVSNQQNYTFTFTQKRMFVKSVVYIQFDVITISLKINVMI